MKTFPILALPVLLVGLGIEAHAYTYTSPLGDQANVTEALWDMDAATTVDADGEARSLVADKNTANPGRHHDLVLYGPTLGESNHPPFSKSLIFNGAGDYARSYSRWYKDRVGVVIELWVWINDTQNTGPVFLASAFDAWRMYLTNNGATVNFQIRTVKGAKIHDAYIHASIAKHTWQHIRAEFYPNAANQGALSLEVSDGLTVSATASGIASSNKMHVDNSRVYLGADDDGKACFHGELDDIRITSQNVASATERGKEMVESFFLDTDPDTVNAGDLATWCLAALWLRNLGPSSHPIVTIADSLQALAKLDSLGDPTKSWQFPLTRPVNDSPDSAVYWGLLSLVRILNHPTLLNSSPGCVLARSAVASIVSNFVRERDIALTESESTEGAIWSVYKSMNHDWLQKATYLLAAQYFMKPGNRIDYADGLTASQHYFFWVKHLKAKLQQMAARGIDPEIASPGYVSITLDALYAMRDYSKDTPLSQQAEKFIDLLLGDAAVESFHSVRGGSKTRSYQGSAARDADGEYLGMWTHQLVNDPVIMPWGATDRHAVGAAMSTYVVPSVVSNLMLSTNKTFFHASRRPAKGYEDDPDRANQNPFYHFQFPSDIRRATFGTPEYIMGSFALLENVPAEYYSQLTRIDQWMGLITSGWKYSRAFFQTGPNVNSASSYSGLTAIQWPGANPARPGECAMLIKRGILSKYPDLSLWLSDDFRANMVFPSSAGTGNWIFSRNANSTTYLAIKDVGAKSPGFYSFLNQSGDHGTDARVDFLSSNPIVAVDAAPSSAYSSFTEFQNDVMDNVFVWNGSFARYVSSGGVMLTMPLDGSNATVNGSIYPGNISKTYSGEYLSNDVYDSPNITLMDPGKNPLVLNFTHDGYAIAPDWTELVYDDFEGGNGNYTCNLPSCGIDHNPANAHQGSYRQGTTQSINIESNGPTSVLDLKTGLDLAANGYNQMKVDFWYRPVGMESPDLFTLQYRNNDSEIWRTIASFSWAASPSAFQFVNGLFRYSSVVVDAPPGGFGSRAKIRFECVGSDASDDVFIDQVKISARVK